MPPVETPVWTGGSVTCYTYSCPTITTSTSSTATWTFAAGTATLAIPIWATPVYSMQDVEASPWVPLGYLSADGIRYGADSRSYDDRGVDPATAAQHRERDAAIEAEAQQTRLRLAAEREQRIMANGRAEEWLLSMLNDLQATQYRRDQTFDVIGSHGGLYRIHHGSMGNVEWIAPDGHSGGYLCAHPNMSGCWLPNGDVAIGQMLALQTDEPAFVRTANVHRGRRPDHAGLRAA